MRLDESFKVQLTESYVPGGKIMTIWSFVIVQIYNPKKVNRLKQTVRIWPKRPKQTNSEKTNIYMIKASFATHRIPQLIS